MRYDISRADLLAQVGPPLPAVNEFVGNVNNAIINPVLALIFTLALFLFMYGGMIFLFNTGDESKRIEGRNHMLWGVIGMVIMVSVFAILNIGLNTFGVDQTDLPQDLPLNPANPVQGTGIQGTP